MTTATHTHTQLRYYPSLLKMLAVLAGSLAFVFGGMSLLQGGTQRDLLNVIAAYLAIGFFGLCAVVALAFLALMIFARKPLLLINSRGIFTPFPIVRFGKNVVWEDVTELAIYEQRVRRTSRHWYQKHPYRSMYWFVVTAKAAEAEAIRTSAFVQAARARYPVLNGAVIGIPLTYLYVKTSPAKGLAILAHIRESFAPELSRYGVIVQDTVLRM